MRRRRRRPSRSAGIWTRCPERIFPYVKLARGDERLTVYWRLKAAVGSRGEAAANLPCRAVAPQPSGGEVVVRGLVGSRAPPRRARRCMGRAGRGRACVGIGAACWPAVGDALQGVRPAGSFSLSPGPVPARAAPARAARPRPSAGGLPCPGRPAQVRALPYR